MEGNGEGNVKAMDVAALQAEVEFPHTGSAQDVVAWWTKNFLTAGHKRLGRIVVKIGKSKKPEATPVSA